MDKPEKMEERWQRKRMEERKRKKGTKIRENNKNDGRMMEDKEAQMRGTENGKNREDEWV